MPPTPSARGLAGALAVLCVVAYSLCPPPSLCLALLRDDRNRLRVMACGGVVRPHRDQGWGPVDAQLLLALSEGEEPLAPGTEPATRWRVGRAGKVALQDDA